MIQKSLLTPIPSGLIKALALGLAFIAYSANATIYSEDLREEYVGQTLPTLSEPELHGSLALAIAKGWASCTAAVVSLGTRGALDSIPVVSWFSSGFIAHWADLDPWEEDLGSMFVYNDAKMVMQYHDPASGFGILLPALDAFYAITLEVRNAGVALGIPGEIYHHDFSGSKAAYRTTSRGVRNFGHEYSACNQYALVGADICAELTGRGLSSPGCEVALAWARADEAP